MTTKNISYEDNYSYRQLLQAKGPELIQATPNITGCNLCSGTIGAVPKIY